MNSSFKKILKYPKILTLKIKVLLKIEKFPSFSQWKQIPKVLTIKEKVHLGSFFLLASLSFIFLISSFYLANTEVVPTKGGTYIEGSVGQPAYINPIYAVPNDIDRELVELMFSGLMKYDGEGNIVPDLAKDYPKIKEDGKIFEFSLREDVLWHDGKKLTSDDVIFTIKTIQNSDYKSPLRANWLEVEIERISDYGVRFKLSTPYSAFLERTIINILPRHIWKDVKPQNVLLNVDYNLKKPIGSGPYKIKKIEQNKLGYVKSLELELFEDYYDKKPFIEKIIFRFFDREKDLVWAAKNREIHGLSASNLEIEGFNTHKLTLPRYFSVFFNLNPPADASKILTNKKIREALNYGTNKEEIINKVLGNQGQIVHSAILPEIYGFNPPSKIYEFDREKANSLLEEAGFIDTDKDGLREKITEKKLEFRFESNLTLASQGIEVRKLQECLSSGPAGGPDIYPEAKVTGYFGDKTKAAVIKFQEKYAKDILEPWGYTSGTGRVGTTTRAKLNELCFEAPKEVTHLKFSLVTPDQPTLTEVANLLKEQWKSIGVDLQLKIIPTSEVIQEFIKPRDYESLLFGEVLGLIPDPFPFWHSTQKKDPGLNIVGYDSKKADKLLEEARQTQDFEISAQKYEEFQDILNETIPCIFLYNPDYIFLTSDRIKGVNVKKVADVSGRFSEIENWYIKTKREWK